MTFENYDDINYGYLRIIVDPQQLRIEYHPALDGVGVKTPDDSVTIDIGTRRQTTYTPNDLGYSKRAKAINDAYAVQQKRRVIRGKAKR